MEPIKSVRRTQVLALVRMLGVDPERVSLITVTHKYVCVSHLPEGRKYQWDGDLELIQIPVTEG